MFLTPSQKSYYCAMKKLGRKKPQKVIKRPLNQVLAMFYDLANSRRFEIAIFVLIFLNMLSMGIEHYNQPHAVFFILEVSNAFFTTVFGLECFVKIIGELQARVCLKSLQISFFIRSSLPLLHGAMEHV
jgi:voltage-gated cation channel